VLEVVSAQLFRVPLVWGSWLVPIVLAAAIVAAAAAVVVPVAVVTRLRPVEVLRYE
jgi:ABC-type antimicrobial peptide transport system permease subunit